MATTTKNDQDPASDTTGAGTTDAPAPQSSELDSLRAQLAATQAQLAASQAQTALGQIQAQQVPAISATFSAPSAPLITKYDTLTKLPQRLPQKLWDALSDEDPARFTPYEEEAPAPLPTAPTAPANE